MVSAGRWMATARATKAPYLLSARHSRPRHQPFRKSPSLQKDELEEEEEQDRDDDEGQDEYKNVEAEEEKDGGEEER